MLVILWEKNKPDEEDFDIHLGDFYYIKYIYFLRIS